MNTCRFCQCEIDPATQFKMTEPNGLEFFFCDECASQIIQYVEKGEAEKDLSKKLSDARQHWPTITGQYTKYDRYDSMIWPSNLASYGSSGIISSV